MLFFFDLNNAYVLAEATRSLSLQDDSVHELEDSLWLGHTIIPRGLSVCENTVMLAGDRGTSIDKGDSLVTVISDLSGDTRFCDRPYVKDGPRARFYAGVPITTPRGINIGAYCVLDDKVRDGLDEKEMQFMRDMSATVMTHLEMVRSNAELTRGARMVAGLGSFVDGASHFRETAQKHQPTAGSPAREAAAPGSNDESSNRRGSRRRRSVESVESVKSPTSQGPPHRQASLPGTNSSSMKARRKAPRKNAMGELATTDQPCSDSQKVFQLAAELVRDAIDVDGVAFFETSASFGETVVERDGVSVERSDAPNGKRDSAGSATFERLRHSSRTSSIARKQCRMIASSLPEDISDDESTVEVPRPAVAFHEGALRTILRRHRKGKVWYFNELGNVPDESSSDADSCDSGSESGLCNCPQPDDVRVTFKHKASCFTHHKRDHIDGSLEVQRTFPQARSVAIVGLWDHVRGRWFAACAFWSYSPLRLFSEEFEVKYVSAFCDVILAELQRLEAETSDRAKSDFISTISHELRSPLHGILGSVECLQEQTMDDFTSELVTQVETCGRTLIDIIDHLLDFSKINHTSDTKAAQSKSRSRSRKASVDLTQTANKTGFMGLEADIALDSITEETVQTAVYSYCCSKDAEKISDRKVDVILDIDQSPLVDWRCHIATGAWKRIVINLVSNALKYTHSGHIQVTLSAVPSRRSRRSLDVTLSVSDTGRGMSQNFLERDLFRAFSQEDSFVEGTGLGLNLVAKIVKALDGQISVQSTKNAGSTFTVALTIYQGSKHRNDLAGSDIDASHALQGQLIGIINPSAESISDNYEDDTVPKISQHPVLASIDKSLLQLGALTSQTGWLPDPDTRISIVRESDFLAHLEACRTSSESEGSPSPEVSGQTPLVVICNSEFSARKMRNLDLAAISPGCVVPIAQPVGPARLLKATRTCEDKIAANGRRQPLTSLRALPVSLNRSDPPNQILVKQLSSEEDLPPAEGPAHVNPATIVDSSLNLDLNIKIQNEATGEIKNIVTSTPLTVTTKPTTAAEVVVDITAKPKEHAQRLSSPKEHTILVVDDNPINVQVLVTYLKKRKHHSKTAVNGLEAVEAYKAAALNCGPGGPDRFRVVLMDINMPICDGFEATRRIREFEKTDGTPPATIIALTGLGDAGAREEAFASGVDLFLTKPVKLKELSKILEGLE